MAEGALSVELEAALDRPHATHPCRTEAGVPAGPRPHPLDVLEELRHRGAVAVGGTAHEGAHRPLAQRRLHREARERGRRDVSVALRAHPPLPDGGCAGPPGAGGIPVPAEHGDLGRLEAPMAEGRIGREAGQASAHDRAPFRHGYLTEPARSPWTK